MLYKRIFNELDFKNYPEEDLRKKVHQKKNIYITKKLNVIRHDIHPWSIN